MSIINNFPFLHDHPSDDHRPAAPGHSYAQGYGNHVASAQAFAPLGHARKTGYRHSGAPARPTARSANNRFALCACG